MISEFGLDSISPEVVLGHSLGEYSALVANHMLNITDAAKLIKKRGELMNSAIKPNISGMAAIIGKNSDFVDSLVKKYKLNIEIANDNSPMQIVVSGMIDDLIEAKNKFVSEGVKKFIILNVSAAFHSKYMLEAQDKMNEEIDNVQFHKTNIPIISNYSASMSVNLDEIIASLKKQMANRVNWTMSIRTLDKTNISKIIEIGPGKVLSGLISRISKKFDIVSIDKIEDLEKINK